jgi:diguanylate cyclase (GGDEF)-like protein
VLVQIAGELRSFARENRMLVARHGGEEFAVLMIGATNEQAAQYAEDIRRACAAKEVISDDVSTRVTISIGLTVSRDEIDLSKIMRIRRSGALYRQTTRAKSRCPRGQAVGTPRRLTKLQKVPCADTCMW